MTFRRLFMQTTASSTYPEGVDPFTNGLFTIASACLRVYRGNFMGEQTIARIPIQGYRSRRKHSAKATAWLEWTAHEKGIEIAHAGNVGEVHLPDARKWPGGYDGESKTVYSFLGCFFHGHLKHYKPQEMNPLLNASMGDLYRESRRSKFIYESLGYRYVEMWECDWDEAVPRDANLGDRTRALRVAPPIQARDMLYGGRCGAARLWAVSDADVKIGCTDVNSLYPYCCKWKKYQIGHPRVFTSVLSTDVSESRA